MFEYRVIYRLGPSYRKIFEVVVTAKTGVHAARKVRGAWRGVKVQIARVARV